MLARPPALNHEKNYHGLMENILQSEQMPVLHFSEILSPALGLGGIEEHKGWFARHLVDPRTFLKAMDLLG